MSVQQIPTILKTMSPHFVAQNAIKITASQLNMMTEVVQEHCRTHEAPRLYGILSRIKRRMNQTNSPHLWQTEFDYFASSMMQVLKESDYCRVEDSIEDIDEIFRRQNKTSIPGHSRYDDKAPLLGFFG